MDPAACRVIYIDDRFNTERWISRDGLSTPATPQKAAQNQADFAELPYDLQANVNAFLTVFNQVYICHSGRSFSSKLSEIHESVKTECTPIIACFDVGSESTKDKDHHFKSRPKKFDPTSDSPLPSPLALRREITFSSESDESYGLQLLSRISADLQVDEGVKTIIPVAIVQPKRRDSYDQALEQQSRVAAIARSPYGSETSPAVVEDKSDTIDSQMMLQCLDAGALDVVKSPLDKAGIMGLTVHAYRIYKMAKKEQASFMAMTRRGRKQSWVGMEDEKPYAYLREAMVRKLLKGICEPETVIEDYQHRGLNVDSSRRAIIQREIGSWGFSGHDFSEDELVFAGYYMLSHALRQPELERWRMKEAEILHFMQGCRVAYNSFVLYHNFRHAVDVLQSLFYFIVQIGVLPAYPVGSSPPPLAHDKSPIGNLLTPLDALTLLVSAIGHDVGHPGVNNMFLVKLNAPLAQLYNDQSVLEAFHCAAYSQILRRHWPSVFNDKAIRKLMISSILATDMGVHSDYMQQLGQLQEKIHESQTTDGWSPKDVEAYKVLTCGLLIKCADISNVARPWAVAEKWTHLLQQEFANQGEMEEAVGIETTLFGGPPELGNMLKLANGQIGFMTIFAHPLFANVADIIPAMGFAAEEIITNKGVWFTKAEHEKRRTLLHSPQSNGVSDSGMISPRTQSPAGGVRKPHVEPGEYFPSSPLSTASPSNRHSGTAHVRAGSSTADSSRQSSLAAVAGIATPMKDHTLQGVGSTKSIPRRSSHEKRTSTHAPLHTHTHTHKPPAAGDGSSYTPSEQTAAAIAANQTHNQSHSSIPAPSLPHHPISPPSTDGPSDDRRDEAVSMRAGSERIPTLVPPEAPTLPHSPANALSPLSKFTFATSNDTEPTRTYDPAQNYPPQNQGARASAPFTDLAHQANLVDMGMTESRSNESTTPGYDDTKEGLGSRTSAETKATSYAEDDGRPPSGRPGSSNPNNDMFERRERDRAISAPIQRPLGRSGSGGGGGGGGGGGSKNNVQTTIVNGQPTEEQQQGRRTMPRRRSRLRMGLTFWKGLGSGSARDKDRERGGEVESGGVEVGGPAREEG